MLQGALVQRNLTLRDSKKKAVVHEAQIEQNFAVGW